MTAPTMTEAERIADVLRSAAAWLRLAAERLDAGEIGDAGRMARLGVLGAEGVPSRIAALSEHAETAT